MTTKNPRLCEIIAVVDGTKNRTKDKLTAAHHALQKPELFSGHQKTYRPKGDDVTSELGEQLPPDTRNVTANAEDIIKKTAEALTELFNVELAREATNAHAVADVVVDGKVLLSSMPVTYLLFLDKQLTDIHTFVKKLPTLDASERWTFDPAQAMFATSPAETARTKKITEPLVLYPHTDKHPAQVKETTRDVVAGYWSTIKYSTALQQTRVADLVARVEKLQKAVKVAREQANSAEVVVKPAAGETVFGYLFA